MYTKVTDRVKAHLRLQISVYNSSTVHEVYSRDQFTHDETSFVLCEMFVVSNPVQQFSSSQQF